MTTRIENIFDLKVGDRITFTNKLNCKVDILVKRVEQKSWYGGEGLVNGRNSYGTLKSYTKHPDFKIIRSN